MASSRSSIKVLSADKLLKQIADAIDCEEAVEKALNAGADAILPTIKSSLQSVLSAEHKDGEMVQSLGKTTVKKDNKDNLNIKVGFAEPRKSDGKSNAMVANILEHGNSRQMARPWLKPIKKQIEAQATEAISKTFDEEIKAK